MIHWINKTMYLQVMTIGKQAHLGVTSTQVNQPNKHKACMPLLYINYRIYNVHICILYSCI